MTYTTVVPLMLQAVVTNLMGSYGMLLILLHHHPMHSHIMGSGGDDSRQRALQRRKPQ